MTTPPADPDSIGDAAPTKHRSRGRTALKWVSIALASVLVITAGAAIGDYFYIKSKLTTVGTYIPPQERPKVVPAATKAENFLIMGSDTRAGANGKSTGGKDVEGARSDTTILLHISANAKGATLVSIPRDSYVHIPACEIGPKGQMSTPTVGKFNEAFSIGENAGAKYAPSCTVHTVESLTGVRINHFVVVDFVGFRRIVDALHGVRMCVSEPLVDPIHFDASEGINVGSGLNLPAGPSVEISGQQALDLMRARYALDGGGDLPRIKRQQEFLAAMIRKATSTGLLASPLELQHFLVAAASSITTDGFGFGTMRKLANALHHVGAGGVHLLTVPNTESAPGMPYGDVAWAPHASAALWKAIRDDKPIPGSSKAKTNGPPLVVSPSSIAVNVENGTTVKGAANAFAAKLRAKGFDVVSVGNAPSTNYHHTVVKYGPTKVESSQTVAESLPGSVRRADPSAGTVVTVIVGDTAQKVVKVTVTNPTSGSSISSFAASSHGCLS